MTTDAPTQAIPRVPVADAAVTAARVPAPSADIEVDAAGPAVSAPEAEVAAPGPDTEAAREVSVNRIYEAGLANLEALHDRWAAAMSEIVQARASGGPEAAAA